MHHPISNFGFTNELEALHTFSLIREEGWGPKFDCSSVLLRYPRQPQVRGVINPLSHNMEEPLCKGTEGNLCPNWFAPLVLMF